MRIRCIIIDDEPLARRGLKEYIDEVEFLECVGDFDAALKATELIASGEVQLIFLDIQMPRITGLDFIRTLPQAPPVIFTTAYPNHALEGFEVNALDYLVKPISFERFLKAALKAKEYYSLREKELAEPRGGTDHFYIKSDNKLVKIAFDDILFVEGLQNYVCIHTSAKKYVTYLTFKAVDEYLPAAQFLKVHKSYLVAAAQVDSIEGNEVIIGQHHIPISRNLKDEVMEKLLGGRFLKR
ncbi:MAG: LytTR family DNA-binding domain-containing protein [Ferruginibacter sp.]|nr:LytTR family DNA-binding domain-containing protein [Ferruginibacter sp.]